MIYSGRRIDALVTRAMCWVPGWVVGVGSGRYAFIGILIAIKYHAGFAECHSGVLSQGELAPATLVRFRAFG
jgi:hypothetical protein